MSRARRFDASKPIDLHTHSSVSDGTEPPADVVRKAAATGLGTIALTDHDTTAGWASASDEARRVGITLIPGIEFSTRIDYRSVHVLGYLFDPDDAAIIAETDRIRVSRVTRAERMVERIGADYPLTWDDVLAAAEAGATVGRPHIADALVLKGIAPDRSAAFASILSPGGKYYQSHYSPPPSRAISLIRAAGGVPVLAHPGSRGSVAIADAHFGDLVDAGLLGLEIYHRENEEPSRKRLRDLAARYDLIVTGSSDYHGSGKPNTLGEHTTEPAMLDRILGAGTGCEPVFANAATGDA